MSGEGGEEYLLLYYICITIYFLLYLLAGYSQSDY